MEYKKRGLAQLDLVSLLCSQSTPKLVNTADHKKSVSGQSALVIMTMSPASSASEPICWAMVKDVVAVDEANAPMSAANSMPRNPAR